MEAFVFSVYGLWFWLTRSYRTARYREAADTLKTARLYLLNDFGTRASTRDRGYMLSHHVEALDLLARHSAFAVQTSRRFASLNECRRFIVEELIGPQPAIDFSQPVSQIAVPREPFFASIASRVSALVASGLNSLPSLASFWNSESAGSIADLRHTRWGMDAAFASSANPLARLADRAKPQVQ
jgi:hypothetical protein